MGHIGTDKSSLVPLIDRLNRYPVGLVDNEILREILTLLFSEQEAFVASRFPLEEATLPELCRFTKMEPETLLPVLETMADKGLVMDLPYGGDTYYLLMPGTIGFFEFTFMKHRTDLPLEKVARLMSEYLYADPVHGQASEFFGSVTPLTRSLVHQEHIPVTSVVTTYESAQRIIEESSFGAAGLCFCRHKKEHLGGKCKKGAPTADICISLGPGARFFVRRGFAEQKTKAEMLEIIDRARDLHLTHITDNVRQRPSFICNCCGCCCELVRGVQAGYHDGIAKTGYIAAIDPDSCDYCGECFTACNVRAIGLARENGRLAGKDRYSTVNRAICLGCGACITSCDREAITLTPREKTPLPAENRQALLRTILREKGRLKPYITARIKKKIRRLVSAG